MKLTPLEVEILLHYYHSSNDFPNLDAPSIASSIESFVGSGLLRRDNSALGTRFYGVNEALKPFVDAVCSVPLPKQKWTI